MEKDYYIIVLNNHEVLLKQTLEFYNRNDIKFIIYCHYLGKTGSGMHKYYEHTLHNTFEEPLENNSFDWDGLECKLYPNESWRPFNDKKFSTICLSMDITDKLGLKRNVQFRNENHTLASYASIFEYLDTMSRVGTHQAVNEIYELREKIKELQGELR